MRFSVRCAPPKKHCFGWPACRTTKVNQVPALSVPPGWRAGLDRTGPGWAGLGRILGGKIGPGLPEQISDICKNVSFLVLRAKNCAGVTNSYTRFTTTPEHCRRVYLAEMPVRIFPKSGKYFIKILLLFILYYFSNYRTPKTSVHRSKWPSPARRLGGTVLLVAAGATCLERKQGLAVVFCRKTPQLRLALSWPEWFHLRIARSFW